MENVCQTEIAFELGYLGLAEKLTFDTKSVNYKQ